MAPPPPLSIPPKTAQRRKAIEEIARSWDTATYILSASTSLNDIGVMDIIPALSQLGGEQRFADALRSFLFDESGSLSVFSVNYLAFRESTGAIDTYDPRDDLILLCRAAVFIYAFTNGFESLSLDNT